MRKISYRRVVSRIGVEPRTRRLRLAPGIASSQDSKDFDRAECKTRQTEAIGRNPGTTGGAARTTPLLSSRHTLYAYEVTIPRRHLPSKLGSATVGPPAREGNAADARSYIDHHSRDTRKSTTASLGRTRCLVQVSSWCFLFSGAVGDRVRATDCGRSGRRSRRAIS